MISKSKYYWGLLAVLVSVFVIGNCRPKGDGDVEPVDSTALSACILLSERINGSLLRVYEYDTTRTLSYMAEYAGTDQLNKIVKRYTFEYNSKKTLIRLRETNLAERDKSYIYELDYTSKGQLKAIRPFRVYNSGPRVEDSLTITYGTNARIAEIKSMNGTKSKWEYDTAGNVRKWLVRSPLMSSDSLVAEYATFDDKVNIYTFSQGMQLINLLAGKAPSKRNPLKYVASGQSIDAIYQYNNKHVPTQAVFKFKTSNNSLRETVYAYELSCK